MIGITGEALARRIGRPVNLTLAVLDEMEAEGLCEQQNGRWRLTDQAERRFGAALRGIALQREEAA